MSALDDILAQVDPRKLRFSALRGNATAQTNLAVHFESEGDDQSAVVWYRRAARQGHARAQYNLGVHYAEGRGVPQSWGESFGWYQKAAEQGYVNAMFNLAMLFMRGDGCVRDLAKAASLFETAADMEEPDSQFVFGVLLLDDAQQKKVECFYRNEGWPVQPDPKKARFLLQAASRKGQTNAREALELLGWELT